MCDWLILLLKTHHLFTLFKSSFHFVLNCEVLCLVCSEIGAQSLTTFISSKGTHTADGQPSVIVTLVCVCRPGICGVSHPVGPRWPLSAGVSRKYVRALTNLHQLKAFILGRTLEVLWLVISWAHGRSWETWAYMRMGVLICTHTHTWRLPHECVYFEQR